MVTLEKDLVAIGRIDYFQSSLYIMTCQNQDCEWQTISQKLKIARVDFVVMLIPDEFCGKYWVYFILEVILLRKKML